MTNDAAASFVFEGTFEVESFHAFARRRAARLSLSLAFGAASPQAVALSVCGPAALVDAFEMACSLGPIDCLVIDVQRQELE